MGGNVPAGNKKSREIKKFERNKEAYLIAVLCTREKTQASRLRVNGSSDVDFSAQGEGTFFVFLSTIP